MLSLASNLLLTLIKRASEKRPAHHREQTQEGIAPANQKAWLFVIRTTRSSFRQDDQWDFVFSGIILSSKGISISNLIKIFHDCETFSFAESNQSCEMGVLRFGRITFYDPLLRRFFLIDGGTVIYSGNLKFCFYDFFFWDYFLCFYRWTFKNV